MSPIQLLSMHQIYSFSDLYGNSLKRFTLRRWSCEVLSLQVGSQRDQISRKPRFCSHAFMFSSSSLFFLHLPLRHGKRVVPLIALMDARKHTLSHNIEQLEMQADLHNLAVNPARRPATTDDGISFDKAAGLKRFHSHSLAQRSIL